MPVTLRLNNWCPNGNTTIVENPTVADVRQLLNQMDGVARTELCVSDSVETGLVITGCFERRLMCKYMSAFDNHVLADEARSNTGDQ